MNVDLKISRNSPEEMLIDLWKIFDLPTMNRQELLGKISFELFFMKPHETLDFIAECEEKDLLLMDEDGSYSLKEELQKKIDDWQEKRKKVILSHQKQAKKSERMVKSLSQSKNKSFKIVLDAFVDKATLARGAVLKENDFTIHKYDFKEGIIKAEAKGSKENPYIIEIDTQEQTVKHDCHDFRERRAPKKKFCKHLARIFLLLKEKSKEDAESFLNAMAETINDWEFTA